MERRRLPEAEQERAGGMRGVTRGSAAGDGEGGALSVLRPLPYACFSLMGTNMSSW